MEGKVRNLIFEKMLPSVQIDKFNSSLTLSKQLLQNSLIITLSYGLKL